MGFFKGKFIEFRKLLPFGTSPKDPLLDQSKLCKGRYLRVGAAKPEGLSPPLTIGLDRLSRPKGAGHDAADAAGKSCRIGWGFAFNDTRLIKQDVRCVTKQIV